MSSEKQTSEHRSGPQRLSSSRTTTICAVWIELPPRSVRNFGWVQPFLGDHLWAHCIANLRRFTDAKVIIVCPPGSEDLKQACIARGFDCFESHSAKQLPSIIEAAATYNACDVIVPHGLLGTGLMPFSVVGQVLWHHQQRGGGATVLGGLPPPLALAVLTSGALDVLRTLPPSVGDDLTVILATLERMLAQNGQSVGFRIERVLLPELTSGDVPRFIPWMYAGDVARIERAVTEIKTSDDTAPLRNLKELTISALNDSHKPLIRKRPRHRRIQRILFASNPSAYTGAEEALINTLRALAAHDLEIHCLVAQEGLFTDRCKEAGAVVHCPNRDCANPRVDTFLLLHRIVERISPDVLHNNATVGVPLLSVAKTHGVPIVQWVRVSDCDRISDHLISADMILAVSQFIARQVGMQMVRAEQVHVLYDCVDCNRYFSNEERRTNVRCQLGYTPDDFVVLCIARFAPPKRHDVLVQAIALAAERHKNLRLLMIGDPRVGGETYQQTMDTINRLRLGSLTTVVGFQNDILGFQDAADALVVCAEHEPLGNVVLEGMALGKAVLVAASGGLVEMIKDGHSGLHCKPGDPMSFAEAVGRIIDEPALRNNLGRHARLTVESEFSFQVHADRLMSLYTSLDHALSDSTTTA